MELKSGRIVGVNKYLVIKVLSAIIFAIVSAVGYSLDIAQITNLNFKWWPLIGFCIFFGLVTWIIIELYIKINRILNSKPRLEFQEKRETPLFRDNKPMYHGLQVWFINKPVSSTIDSIAEDVTAKITFYNINTKEKISVYGLWILSVAFDFTGFRGATNKISKIPPNNEPHKLAIAIKWEEDECAYAFVEESRLYSNTGDFREKGREIKQGRHYVEILLSGTRLSQPPVWFILTNPGKDANLSLSDPIKSPDLYKEGFDRH
jgi:hypothetical protein